MKICVVFCVLSLTNSIWTAPIPEGPAVKTFKGIQTLYFSSSTALLTLNCNCSNEYIQWHANRTLCKIFSSNSTFYTSNNALCENCTRTSFTLYPPFVPGAYFCIGSGGETSCYYRWYLREQNFSSTTPAPQTLHLIQPLRKNNNHLAVLGFFAFICLISANYLLTYHLYEIY